MKAVLFTETGVIPIRHRRIILALRYLAYLVDLPMEPFTRHALEDSKVLLNERKPGWLGDLVRVLDQLPSLIQITMEDIESRPRIERVMARVEDSCAL